MENKTRNATIAFAALKATQQVAHDLEGAILDNTKIDYLFRGTEQICRITAAGTIAYAIDEVGNHLETLTLPKYLRGLIPLTISTLGVGAVINYFGNNFGIQEGVGFLATTGQLFRHYQENLVHLINLSPEAHAGYLLGAFVAIKSGLRFGKNLGEKLIESTEKKQGHREITQE